MRSILTARCVSREHRPDVMVWARDCIRRPARYGADERTRQIVAELLAQVTR